MLSGQYGGRINTNFVSRASSVFFSKTAKRWQELKKKFAPDST